MVTAQQGEEAGRARTRPRHRRLKLRWKVTCDNMCSCSVVSAGTATTNGKGRSVMRRVTERDKSASTAMVLFVAQVLLATITLTDGW